MGLWTFKNMVLVNFFFKPNWPIQNNTNFFRVGEGWHSKMVMVYFGCLGGLGSNLVISKFQSNLLLFFETGQEEKLLQTSQGD